MDPPGIEKSYFYKVALYKNMGRLEHISCNGGPTNCPDQLSLALKEATR